MAKSQATDLNFSQFIASLQANADIYKKSEAYTGGYKPPRGEHPCILYDFRMQNLVIDGNSVTSITPEWLIHAGEEGVKGKRFLGQKLRLNEKGMGFFKGFLQLLSGAKDCGDLQWAEETLKAARAQRVAVLVGVDYNTATGRDGVARDWIRDTILKVMGPTVTPQAAPASDAQGQEAAPPTAS